jgi:hypothetical protein
MDAIRVYQIAKLLELDSRVLTEKLRELGFNVRNYMSLLDDSSVQKIMEHFKPATRDPSNVEQRIAGKVRGYELAKEFNIDHRDLVLLLKAKGYRIKSYMSTLDNEAAEEIRQFLRGADPREINRLIDLGSEIRIRSACTRRRKAVTQPWNSSSNAKSTQQKATHAQDSGVDSSLTVLKQPQVSVQEKPAKTILRGKTFIVDGLNIVRTYSRRKGHLSLEALLSVLLEIRRRGGAFICIFDANTQFELEEKATAISKSLYLKLTDSLPDEFVEVPGGKRADDFILLQAAKNGRLIISNDRFRDYRTEYPWLERERNGECIFKGTTIREHIEIPDLKLSIPLRKDIEGMTNELINQCKRQ